jgi:AcrR family transcriptional regulator
MTLRERKQQRAREQIVAAAYALFAERGFAQVTVTDIAERAEVGRTTFFRYFGDKQEVVFADEDQLLDVLAEAAARPGAPSATATEALQALWALFEPMSAVIVGDPATYTARERLLARNPELSDRVNRKFDRIAEGLEAVLRAHGTEPALATLSAQLAMACFRTARKIAGDDPAKLVPAMREAVANTLGIHGVPPRFVPR